MAHNPCTGTFSPTLAPILAPFNMHTPLRLTTHHPLRPLHTHHSHCAHQVVQLVGQLASMFKRQQQQQGADTGTVQVETEEQAK